jgi:hypothetical protein
MGAEDADRLADWTSNVVVGEASQPDDGVERRPRPHGPARPP